MKTRLRVIGIVLLLVIVGVFAVLTFTKTATIVIGEQVHMVDFWGLKVSDALASSGIAFYEGDIIKPAPHEMIQKNTTIVVLPASWVVVSADGDFQTLWTAERIPERIFDLASINLNSGDEIWLDGSLVDPQTPLSYAPSHALQVRRTTTISFDDKPEVKFTSNAFTLGEALSEAGFTFYNLDHLTPSLNTPLTGQDIHALLDESREVVIQSNNQEYTTRVRGNTVGEVLGDAKMPLQGLDYSIPAEDEPVPQNGKIRVVQVREEILLEQNPIPFNTLFQPSSQVDLDDQQVIQVGEYGIEARRLRVVRENSQEVSRNVEEEWIAKEPKSRIIGYGTKIEIRTLDTPDGPIKYWRSVQAYATSYSPCRLGVPDQCSSTTASGAELKKGVIGVIRSWYNNMKGLQVYIPGYGFGTIEDIGAGLSGSHWVDLGYSDQDWVRWSGYVTVYFMTPVPANIMYLLD